MSRRSSRLRSVGYYNSDDESDSSTTTTISYRENPVKVFKKKSGRKSASRTTSNASSASNDSLVAAAVTPPPTASSEASAGSGHFFSSVSVAMATPTPRPPISPVPTPVRSPSAPPQYYVAGRAAGAAPGPGELAKPARGHALAADSSGYSSSDGAPVRPASAAAFTGAARPTSAFSCRVSGDFLRLRDSVSGKAAAAHSKIVHVTSLVGSPSLSSHMMKVVSLALLLIVLVLFVWLLLPWLAPLVSRLSVTNSSSAVKGAGRAAPAAAPAPAAPSLPSLRSATPPAPTMDEAAVFAAVKAKMKPLLEEMQLKQEHLVTQIEHMHADVQALRVELHAVDAGGRQRLEEELASLGRKVAANHADSTSATAKLRVRLAAMEAHNAQLAQELSSSQQQVEPPAAARPEPAAPQDPLTPELQEALEKWLRPRFQEQEVQRLAQSESCPDYKVPIAHKMPDFALESQGASVISTRCSETYRTRSACVTLFGFPLWYPSESPRIVIQGYPVLLPGKCWAFHGVQGTLVIALSHPITISHVTLDHLPKYHSPTGHIDSAPKDFEVYGMRNETDEGTLLGRFTYDQDGESMQTFQLPEASTVVYRAVELRVLSNWGHVEYTCLYRFRVHGQHIP